MSDPQFSWPSKGASGCARKRIAAFLVMDIQRSPDWARDLLGKIAAVKTGELPTWERTGNAYRLNLAAAGGRLEDLVDPASSPQDFPLEELEAAVTAWMTAID
jgi:hypothetical protein